MAPDKLAQQFVKKVESLKVKNTSFLFFPFYEFGNHQKNFICINSFLRVYDKSYNH